MEEKQILDRLQRQCSRAEYCTQDVRRKALKALEGDAEAADRVTAALVADRFVDDRRYAAAYAREKAALQGWGEVKIRFMLQGKGIARDVVDEALREIDPGRAASKLERLAAERYRIWKDDPQCRLKLLKFILGRGYPYEEASEAVEAVMRQR
ncbi:MAG: RecX family transcriptional regulator [Bacteroidales bacterium]|nr:RecX family transcriptional regulator [Bacteroidales bacterium]